MRQIVRSFNELYGQAVLRKGSEAAVESSLPTIKSPAVLGKLPDSYYLSELSRRVFRAGLKHAMVDAKWPAFEQAFHGFDPVRVAYMSDDELEALMSNAAIIRHLGKIKSVRNNAQMVLDIAKQHGSFALWIAAWPTDNIVALWTVLKKQGTQLGGQSGARFLRMVGKDTFLLTDDVNSILIREGVVDKNPTSQKDLRKIQDAFNHWHQQCRRSLSEISRIISFIPES